MINDCNKKGDFNMVRLGVDLGGTNIAVGVVNDQ
jgi:predicted NBD/HSP70 family sugar kinase